MNSFLSFKILPKVPPDEHAIFDDYYIILNVFDWRYLIILFSMKMVYVFTFFPTQNSPLRMNCMKIYVVLYLLLMSNITIPWVLRVYKNIVVWVGLNTFFSIPLQQYRPPWELAEEYRVSTWNSETKKAVNVVCKFIDSGEREIEICKTLSKQQKSYQKTYQLLQWLYEQIEFYIQMVILWVTDNKAYYQKAVKCQRRIASLLTVWFDSQLWFT